MIRSLKNLIGQVVIIAAAALFTLPQMAQASCIFFGDCLPDDKEYPKFREIRELSKTLELSSRKDTIAKCQKEVVEGLPEAIKSSDKHFIELEVLLKDAHHHVRSMDAVNEIAARVRMDWSDLLAKGGNPYRELHGSTKIAEECKYQTEAVNPFNIEIRKTVTDVMDHALAKADSCVKNLKDFKSAVQEFQSKVKLEGGKLKDRVEAEVKDTDTALNILGGVTTKIQEYRVLLLDRYSRGLKSRKNENLATIEQLKAGQAKCVETTRIIADLETKNLPTGASTKPISPATSSITASD